MNGSERRPARLLGQMLPGFVDETILLKTLRFYEASARKPFAGHADLLA